MGEVAAPAPKPVYELQLPEALTQASSLQTPDMVPLYRQNMRLLVCTRDQVQRLGELEGLMAGGVCACVRDG